MAWHTQADVAGGFADEASLLAGLRAGRREAFEALHGEFAAPIYNLALRIVDDPGEAQDVAQEVLIKVFRGLPQDEPDLSLSAWLYRVTVNASLDHVRARKRRPVVTLETEREPVAIVDEYERAELAGRVETTLRALPKRQQVALVLRDVNGLSVAETASALGLTRGSADVLLSRARNGFRHLFLAQDDEKSSGPAHCRVAVEALAGGVGGGLSPGRRARVLEHALTCSDCRRTVALWGAAPIGLGLLVHQVALPAKLSLAATFAAASAAGVAIPVAGIGAACAVSAAGATAGTGGSAAAAGSSGAAGAGLLVKLGSVLGLKAATAAAAAVLVVGTAGVADFEVRRAAAGRAADATPAQASVSAAGSGASAGSVHAGGREQAGLRASQRKAARRRQSADAPCGARADGRPGVPLAAGAQAGGAGRGSAGAGLAAVCRVQPRPAPGLVEPRVLAPPPVAARARPAEPAPAAGAAEVPARVAARARAAAVWPVAPAARARAAARPTDAAGSRRPERSARCGSAGRRPHAQRPGR